jgi:hypothetical protein
VSDAAAAAVGSRGADALAAAVAGAMNYAALALTNMGAYQFVLGRPASLGYTNIKPDVFNTVKTAFPAQFAGKEWANLIGDPNLDIKATAYYLKYLQLSVLPKVPNSERAMYTPDQVLEAIYNVGPHLFYTYDVPRLGRAASAYVAGVAPYYTEARQFICTVYMCSGG